MTNWDDLDTFDSVEVRDTNSKYARETYPCEACGGTGYYQGVRIHEEREHCFACRGVGHFVTSPADRAKAKQQRAAAKQRKEEKLGLQFQDTLMSMSEGLPEWFAQAKDGNDFLASLWAAGHKYGELTEKQAAALESAYQRHLESQKKAVAYRNDHPQIVAWLEANNGNFATSLRESLNKWGSLTANQTAAVQRIIDADSAKPTLDLTRIFKLFNSAIGSGAKKPVIRVEGALKLSLAGERSANAGCIYVKDGYNEYMGKITPAGKFFAVKSAPADVEEKLVELAKDPKGAMVRFGRMTGTCACCGRELTNKASIELGIGPICAEKFGVL